MSMNSNRFRYALLGASAMVSAAAVASASWAADARAYDFDMPAQPLTLALKTFGATADQQLIFSEALVRDRSAPALKGSYTPDKALAMLLTGSGLIADKTPGGVVTIRSAADPQGGSAADGAEGTVQALIVTAQKREEDIQDVPIAISAFTQKSLDTMKIEGGPDLLKAIPNVTFTKTNFTSYNIQIRGIGTQAISATTDPAVAVAFNSTPFIRNHLFEQEFFDVERVEVLRGPQGTLYGRNATAGVVNIISAKPTDRWDAMIKGEVGNYKSRRLSGYLNIPVASDKLGVRVAGAWTKRDGYAFNETKGEPTDGRDLYSARLSVRFQPIEALRADFVWEHFAENDDRVRSAKQLCKKDPGPDSVAGFDLSSLPQDSGTWFGLPSAGFWRAFLSQGCVPTSFYSADAYETPNGQALPFIFVASYGFNGLGASSQNSGALLNRADPYLSRTQSRNLRVIQSDLEPTYKARADVLELNVDFDLTDKLTLTSQTGYNIDHLQSTQDFNRFNTAPGFFASANAATGDGVQNGPYWQPNLAPNGIYCDPQLACSDKFMAEDLSRESSHQFTQEFRLTSRFDSPLNFNIGANYTRYKTAEDYIVAFNILTYMIQLLDNSPIGHLNEYWGFYGNPDTTAPFGTPGGHLITIYPEPVVRKIGILPIPLGQTSNLRHGTYIDPNPLEQVNGLGHNYFRSDNPYALTSLAGFGEVYYQITPDLELTAGVRWTDDKKRFEIIPSQVFLLGGGYPVQSEVNQEWKEWTGRLNVDWSPKLSFTDQTMIYASYSRGYKGGGANPPGPFLNNWSTPVSVVHPATFAPEFVNAYEIGSKNTLLGGGLVINGDVFYYDYRNYQISKIVDRSAINENFNAEVWGLELESLLSPTRNIRFNMTFGYEDSAVGNGMTSIDLIDRTAGHSDWMVVKPFVANTSNCIFPASVVRQLIEKGMAGGYASDMFALSQACGVYSPYWLGQPGLGIGYDPSVAPNNGEGFAKDLKGNELPNTPHWTWSLGAQYTKELPGGWLGTLRADYYHQSQSFFRIYNDKPYDKLRAWTNVNLSIKVEQPDQGIELEAYVKNLLNSDAITGAFLNSDDTALTTNVFTIDPRLIGLKLTKRWSGDSRFTGLLPHGAGQASPLTIEVGGTTSRIQAPNTVYTPGFATFFSPKTNVLGEQSRHINGVLSEDLKLTWAPDPQGWRISGALRYGKVNRQFATDKREPAFDICLWTGTFAEAYCTMSSGAGYISLAFGHATPTNYGATTINEQEDFTLADFMAGKDVGLGLLGRGAKSSVQAGLRYAQFNSSTEGAIGGHLDWYVPATYGAWSGGSHFMRASAGFSADRSFKGAGPVVEWDASKAFFGDEASGQAAVDWTLTGGVLFGKQTARATGSESEELIQGLYNIIAPYQNLQYGAITTPAPIDAKRSKNASAPFIGASLGLSYAIQNVKVSGGYRIDKFFNVLDGGLAERKTYDRTIDGPYFKLSVGFGG